MRSVVFLLLLCFFHAQSISAMDLVYRWLRFSSGVKEQSLAVNHSAATDEGKGDEGEEGYVMILPVGSARTTDNNTIVPEGADQQQQLLPVEALTAAETVANLPAVALLIPEQKKLTYAQVVARQNLITNDDCPEKHY